MIRKQQELWQDGIAKTVNFIVTKDCQLACKYCYQVAKTEKERMRFEIAQKAVDYLLDNRALFKDASVIWEFTGGEPFLEIDMIDQICDYITRRMYETKHPWFASHCFSITTNGVNYHSEKVQRYILKNRKHLSIVVTIDGTERKHNLNRVYPNGRGSYRDVVRNIPLWLEQFPEGATKVTVASEDIPYIAESVLHLYSLGIKVANINCIFENVWQEGDDDLFEEQLIQLADAIIDREYYRDHLCSFFSDTLGRPLDKKLHNHNWCGSGKMIAIDAQGNFYPCVRFAQYALRNKQAITVGNVYEGLNTNRLRPFLTLDRCTQSPKECIECDVSRGCAWCQGENYDAANSDTIFQRSVAICKMHKARVRANNYYWNRLFRKLENEKTIAV